MKQFKRIIIGFGAALTAFGCADDRLVTADYCPDNSSKVVPGVCGCEVDDVDANGNTIIDCLEADIPDPKPGPDDSECPEGSLKTSPGICGCNRADVDEDGNTIIDCVEEEYSGEKCPEGSRKEYPGACGCDILDEDKNNNNIVDCFEKEEHDEAVDLCPDDPDKKDPGICGCGVSDVDTDGDGTPDCFDLCKNDSNKIDPGICGCNEDDSLDENGNHIPDCIEADVDLCPDDDAKTTPGVCGCGLPDVDTDADGVLDCLDKCSDDPDKVIPGICGCNVSDSAENLADFDGDGVINCLDGCPNHPGKTKPGKLDCDEGDSDGDDVLDGDDDCPNNPNIQNLKEGQDCSLTKDSDGIDVFEIWSAADISRLREYMSTIGVNAAPGEICRLNEPKHCFGENALTVCETAFSGETGVGIRTEKSCSKCVENGDNVTCSSDVPEKCEETSEAFKAYACCSPETFVGKCEGDVLVSCNAEKNWIERTECSGVCNQDALKCVACLGEPVSEKGVIGACCDPAEYKVSDATGGKFRCVNGGVRNVLTTGGTEGSYCDSLQYVETCVDDHVLACKNNRVVKEKCISGCSFAEEGSKHAICHRSVEQPKPVLKIRLMNDIDLSEINPAALLTDLSCRGNWQSIDLNQMSWDGLGHQITYTSGDIGCSLNRPFFGTVYRSSIENMVLNYDVVGSVPAVLASSAAQSKVSKVEIKGRTMLSAPVDGESFGLDTAKQVSFGVVTQVAYQSLFKDIVVQENISSTIASVSGLVGHASDIVVDKADISIGNVSVPKHKFYGAVMNADGDSVLSHVSVSIQNANIPYGGAGIGESINNLYDVHVDWKDLLASNHAAVCGIGTAFNQDTLRSHEMCHVSVHIDRVKARESADASASLYGLMSRISYGNLRSIDVDMDDVACENFAGLTPTIDISQFEDVDINLNRVEANELIGAIKTVHSSDEYKSSIKSLNLKGGKLFALSGEAVGLIHTLNTASIENVRIEIDELSAHKKSAYGLIKTADSLTLKNVAGRISTLISSYETAAVMNITSLLSAEKFSWYSNAYVKRGTSSGYPAATSEQVSSSLIGLIADKVLFVLKYVVSSGSIKSYESYTYHSDTRTGEMTGVEEPASVPMILNHFSNKYKTAESMALPDSTWTSTMSGSSVYWLKRGENYISSPMSLTNFSSYTQSSVSNIISGLGSDWTSLELKEGDSTIKIPWLK